MYLNIMKVILYSSLFNAFTSFMKLALLFAEKRENHHLHVIVKHDECECIKNYLNNVFAYSPWMHAIWRGKLHMIVSLFVFLATSTLSSL